MVRALSCLGVDMAYARIILEGGCVLEVGTEADGPDALDECVRRVKDLWREAVGEPALHNLDDVAREFGVDLETGEGDGS